MRSGGGGSRSEAPSWRKSEEDAKGVLRDKEEDEVTSPAKPKERVPSENDARKILFQGGKNEVWARGKLQRSPGLLGTRTRRWRKLA